MHTVLVVLFKWGNYSVSSRLVSNLFDSFT
nr:MAG TPA: GRIP-related Arf-binding domain [Caudoviricetes sp.]